METIVIDIKELEKNLDHYIEVGQKTTIKVIKDGKIIFTIVPESQKLMKEFKN